MLCSQFTADIQSIFFITFSRFLTIFDVLYFRTLLQSHLNNADIVVKQLEERGYVKVSHKNVAIVHCVALCSV